MLESWLRRFGAHTASYVLLEGNKEYLTLPSVDGFVAWETRWGCPVIAGDPVCAQRDAPQLLAALRRRAFPRPVLAYSVSPVFRDAFSEAGFDAVPIGAEATFDPSRFTLAGGARAVLRSAVNHATKAGLTVRQHDPLAPGAAATSAELSTLSRAWLAAKGEDELGFLLGQPVLDRPTAKRTFVARGVNRVEGFLVCEPVFARRGWYLDVTRRQPDAVRGTMELLTATALQTFGAEGATFASMGLAPLARLDANDAPPSDSPALSTLCRRAYSRLRRPYDYRDLARYKAKYAPDAWEHRLLCYSGPVAEWVIRIALGVAIFLAPANEPLASA